MLSIHPIKSAGQARHYYAQADYYAKGDESDISSRWFGAGATALGLAGGVEPEAFKAVLDGRLPDGTQLGRMGGEGLEHRAGWDFTLSAPKSVSILALAGGDHRLVGAHHAAVAVAMTVLERDYAVTRKMVNGIVQEEKTGSLVVAQFTHSTSRAVDPQLHTHNVVANATRSGDSRWRSLETRRMYDASMAVGQVYRAELAVRVRELGYDIVTDAHKGTFDIASVPDAVIRGFSKRREEIEKAVETYGYRTAKGLDKAAVRTRSAKGHYTRDELLRGWDNEMAARDFDVNRIIEDAKRKGPLARRSDALQEDLRFAYKNLAEREAVFPRDQVVTDTLRVGLGQYRLQEVEAELSRLIKTGALVPAELNQGRGVVAALTTPAALKKEAYILSLMERGKGEVRPIASSRIIKRAMDNRTLGQGQREAVEHILRSRDRLIGVQGFAGTGKTYALDTVREVAERRGYTLTGLAPTASAAQQLEAGSGIKSQTLASHLVTLNNQTQPAQRPKAVWIVDEASLTNARDMADLLTLSRQTRSRVVVVGDRLQLGAIEYGKPFEQMQQAGLAVAEIREIRRQTDPDLLAAVQSTVEGRVGDSLALIADHVKTIERRDDRIRALVDDFLRMDPQARERAIVLIPDNQTRREVNELIRQALQRQGEVGKDALSIDALTNRGMTRQEKGRAELYMKGDIVMFGRDNKSLGVSQDSPYTVDEVSGKTVRLRDQAGHRIDWQPARVAGLARRGVEVYATETRQLGIGDKLRWQRNDKELGLRNSTTGRVFAIDGNKVTVDFAEHGVKQIDLKQHPHWDYGYASTVHAAQGATVDRVLIHAESWRRNLINRKSFYVSLSRAKFQTTIYTDDAGKLASEVTRRLGEKTSALETKGIAHRQLLDRDGLVRDLTEVMQRVEKVPNSPRNIEKPIEKELGL